MRPLLSSIMQPISWCSLLQLIPITLCGWVSLNLNVAPAHGADACCAHCGAVAVCRKVCQLVCEEKKVTVTCWGYSCEDFCLAGPSCPGCQHCELVCAEDSCSPAADKSQNAADQGADKKSSDSARSDAKPESSAKKADEKSSAKEAPHVHTSPKKFVWREWLPAPRAKIATKAKLMKRTVTKKVPSFKWKVEKICSHCTQQLPVPQVAADAELPPVPASVDVVIEPVREEFGGEIATAELPVPSTSPSVAQ